MVQPGVVTAKLAAAVEAKGLFYPPDPGSMAVSTLGGNVAENAGGLRGLKYGVTLDYVMGLKFFAAAGDLVKTGSRTVKCVTGYNLTGLLVGSEGTLGVISEIILKLIPLPQDRRAMLATFDQVDQASETVAAIIANRIVPATLEFLDNFTIRTVEDYSHVGLPVDAAALLLIEVDGHPAVVAEEAAEGGGPLPEARGDPGAHRPGRGGAGPGLERPPGGPFGPGQTETHRGPGGRHRAPQPGPRHDPGHRGDRPEI